MTYTTCFVVAVVLLETVGLIFVLLLRKGYQAHERRAYGYPHYLLPVWAMVYWAAISCLAMLAMSEVVRSDAPLWTSRFTVVIAAMLVVKGIIWIFLPSLRDTLVTSHWIRIAVSKALVIAGGVLALLFS